MIKYCMCEKVYAVARDGKSTCMTRGGIDAYGSKSRREMKKVYLSKVLCKEDSCYQFVTEKFKEDHPDLEILEFYEIDVKVAKDEVKG